MKQNSEMVAELKRTVREFKSDNKQITIIASIFICTFLVDKQNVIHKIQIYFYSCEYACYSLESICTFFLIVAPNRLCSDFHEIRISTQSSSFGNKNKKKSSLRVCLLVKITLLTYLCALLSRADILQRPSGLQPHISLVISFHSCES